MKAIVGASFGGLVAVLLWAAIGMSIDGTLGDAGNEAWVWVSVAALTGCGAMLGEWVDSE